MVFLDQTFTFFFISSFFLLMDLLESGKIKEGIKNFLGNFGETFILTCQLWSAAQAINLSLV